MEIGIKGEQKLTVTADQLASNVGSGLVAVFATPMMVAAIENTAAASVERTPRSRQDHGRYAG